MMPFTDHATIVLYARYPKKESKPWLTPTNIEYYKKLPIAGKILSSEHIAYGEIPDIQIEPGDLILRVGDVLLTSLLKAAATERSLWLDIRYAKRMVLKKRCTGEIYEVELTDRLDGTPRPYVEVELKMRTFRKPEYTAGAL